MLFNEIRPTKIFIELIILKFIEENRKFLFDMVLIDFVHQVNQVVTPCHAQDMTLPFLTSHLNMAKISGTIAEICIEFLQLYEVI